MFWKAILCQEVLCILTSERMLAHAFAWSKTIKNIQKPQKVPFSSYVRVAYVMLMKKKDDFWMFSIIFDHANACICWSKYTTQEALHAQNHQCIYNYSNSMFLGQTKKNSIQQSAAFNYSKCKLQRKVFFPKIKFIPTQIFVEILCINCICYSKYRWFLFHSLLI